MKSTPMSRAFSKWWDRRKVVGGNRAEADVGWKAGAQWALERAAERLGEGLTGREKNNAADDEREMCIEEIREIAREL
jgi:hypothetical protein